MPPAAGGLDPWIFIELLLRRCHWIFLCGLLLGGAGLYFGHKLWKPTYDATVKLLRTDPQNATEYYKPRQFSEQTYSSLLRAPELIARVAAKAKPQISAQVLNAKLLVTAMRDSDIVMAVLPGRTPAAAIELANIYAQEAVLYTRQIQSAEAGEVNLALKQQLAQMDADVASLNEQLHASSRNLLQSTGPGRTSALEEKLAQAQEQLFSLLANYTDMHPLVQQQRAKIAVLQKEVAESMNLPSPGTTPDQPLTLPPSTFPPLRPYPSTNYVKGAPNKSALHPPPTPLPLQNDLLLSQLQAVSAARLTLASRQREAQLFTDKPPGYCQLLSPATPDEITVHSPNTRMALLGVLGFALGAGGSLLLVMLVEFLDDRLKTADDLKRVTGLPLLATLGDLKRISPAIQMRWAFRTWTALQNRLAPSPNHGLVCGLTSSRAGEGRSTWIGLLAQAASECGFRVLTIAALDKSAENPEPDDDQFHDIEASVSASSSELSPVIQSGSDLAVSTPLTTSVLASPAMVTEKLTGTDPQPYVHIPLPGWVWSLERRKQWHTALSHWSRIDNIVILVELPPASTPETVLLAENLPNLLWLADSTKATAAVSREQLQTLREARCNLVGTVLNHEHRPPLKKRFSRWLNVGVGLALLGLILSWAGDARAQSAQPVPPASVGISLEQDSPATNAPLPIPAPETNLPATNPNPIRAFSVLGPAQRAPWQQRLTLGPGDVLNLGLFGQPEMTRTEVLIGPDGRLSYLQADVQAAGLTVDELRNKLDQELGKYYRSPRTIVSPVAFRSKKYYVLGKVANRGVYVLDQPITIIEAVARARGLETGLVDNQNSVDLADLQRSFLMRGGKRMPVDFEKLFQEGDLSQNIPIEPNDYLYFAAANLKEVYVLGEVNAPGVVTFTARTTVVGAISIRGGFTEKAYKGRVLVIRGSLQRPSTFVVNVWGTLEARGPDFKLQSKDIIYVSHRPFIRVEEVLDLAATAFIQSAISAWATEKIGPIIESPFLP